MTTKWYNLPVRSSRIPDCSAWKFKESWRLWALAIATLMVGLSGSLSSGALAQDHSAKTAKVTGEASPLQVEEAKLQASPDAIRFHVIKSVYRGTTLTESTFRRMSSEKRDELTSDAFYLASAKLANTLPLEQDMYDLFGKIKTHRPKDVMLELEAAYFAKYSTWPEIVAVDVASLNQRLRNQNIIR